MTGIVIDKDEEYYTNIKDILETLGDIYKQYNWLISGYECYPQDEKIAKVFSGEAVFMPGEDLMNLLEIENFQLIWGVLTAINKDISRNDVMKSNLPYVESNKNIWKIPISMQHPLAEIEIIGWDGISTVIKSKNDNVIQRIKVRKEHAIDLEDYILA